MNFLSHNAVLPPGASPIMRIGAAVPDLWILLPRRPLAMVVLRELTAMNTADSLELAKGIKHHLQADAIFHRHDDFMRRTAELAPKLQTVWPSLRHAQLAAHVLVEMLLDRWLLLTDQGCITRYYACFTEENISVVTSLGSKDDAGREAMGRVLGMFVGSQFLQDYRSAAGLIMRFLRSIGRTSFGGVETAPAGALEACAGQWYEELVSGSEELLDSVRKALAQNV